VKKADIAFLLRGNCNIVRWTSWRRGTTCK